MTTGSATERRLAFSYIFIADFDHILDSAVLRARDFRFITCRCFSYIWKM